MHTCRSSIRAVALVATWSMSSAGRQRQLRFRPILQFSADQSILRKQQSHLIVRREVV
jgi:hypothetical protein